MYICIPSESGKRSSFVSLPLFHARLHGQLQLIFHAQGEDKASDLASNGQGHEDGDLASHAEGGDQAGAMCDVSSIARNEDWLLALVQRDGKVWVFLVRRDARYVWATLG